MKRLLLLLCLLEAPLVGQTPTYADVAYASPSSLDTQKLDIYHPTGFGGGPYNVVMLLEGGGVTGGQGREVFIGSAITQAILSRGWAVAAISYRRLTPMWPTDLNDCKAAVRFLRANNATYNLTTTIVAWGKSGGGRLASLLATTNGISLYDGSVGPHTGTSSAVAAAVAQYAPLDFTTIYADETNASCAHNPATPEILGCTPGGGTYAACLSVATEASPALQVNAGSAPTLTATGTAYCQYYLESHLLRSNLAAAGIANAEITLTGAAHGGNAYFTYYQWNLMFRFLCGNGIPAGCQRTYR